MSGTVTSPPWYAFASTAFSDGEKADVRRLCGYPIYGGEGPQGFVGWRFFQAYGLLEYRMNNLAPAEYQTVRWRLSLLYPIESAISGMYATINVDTAAVFKRNAKEFSDRIAHFNNERNQLCDQMGVPPGPNLEGQAGTIRFVV